MVRQISIGDIMNQMSRTTHFLLTSKTVFFFFLFTLLPISASKSDSREPETENSKFNQIVAFLTPPLSTVETTLQFKYHSKQKGCIDDIGTQGLNANLRGECGNLQNQDLSGTDLKNQNLKGANLRGVDLSGANLSRANLEGTILAEATLSQTDLQEANLTNADLSSVHISKSKLQKANLTGTNFNEAIIRNTDMREAKVSQAKFSKAILFGVNMSGLDLTNLDLTGAEVSSSNLSDAILKGLNFEDGFCDKTEFVRSDLRQVNFKNAEMYRANFIGANLQEAILSQALLTQANLTGAQLQNANLSQADLTRADLTDSYLTKANLNKAILNGAVLRGADLQNSNLTGASLSGTNLSETDLRGADLTGSVVGDQGRILPTGSPDGSVLRPTELSKAVCNETTQLPKKLRCKKQSVNFIASARVPKITRKKIKAEKPVEIQLLPLGTLPTKKNWSKFIEAVRAKVFERANNLPDFVCNQATRRFIRVGKGGWRQEAYTVHELSFYNKQKHYKNLSLNGMQPQSAGVFRSAVGGLFYPKTESKFKLDRLEKIDGRQVIRISFKVSQKTSNRTIRIPEKDPIIYGYRGRCWVDISDYQVVRLRLRDVKMPKNDDISGYQLWVDYEKKGLSKGSVYLPTKVEERIMTKYIGDTGLGSLSASGVTGGAQGGDLSAGAMKRGGGLSTRFMTVFNQYQDHREE